MMFGQEASEEFDEEERSSKHRSGGGFFGKLIGGLIGLCLAAVFIPAGLIAGLTYTLLSRARLRVSVISIFTLASLLVAYIMWTVSDGSGRFMNFVKNLSAAGDNWTTLITPVLAINLAVGAFVGLLLVAWSARAMRTTPHLRGLEGSWMYKFKYRRTPLEWLILRNRKKALATEDMSDDSRVALGVNLDDDQINYRYYQEANKQTIVTGGVGSGKALAGDTLLPTPDGFMKARDVRSGDTLLDERGCATEVLSRYQPFTLDHYEIGVSEGIALRACGDHRWPVKFAEGDGFVERVLNTREIADTVCSTDVYISRLTQPADYVTSELNDFEIVGEASMSSSSITDAHMIADVSQRLALLQSSLNASGLRSRGQVVFRSRIEGQAARLQSVVRSLGQAASALVSNSGLHEFVAEVHPALEVAGLAYSQREWPLLNISEYLKLESVEEISDSAADYFCFEVDSDSHLFLCTDAYLVTHNTVSILSMILADIKNGVSVIAVDFKRDPAFAARLAYWANAYDREFYHFTSGAPENYSIATNPRGQAQYDALHASSPAVRADMVLGMREYAQGSEVYKSNMQQLLQVLFSAIDEADRSKAPNILWDAGGINQIASCIEADNLTDLTIACEGKRIQKDIEAIRDAAKGKSQIKHALEELQGQMRTLTASQYGRWMRTDSSTRDIDLFGLTNGEGTPPVVLFSIDSDAEEEFSRHLGALIMADITNVSAMRRNAKLKNQVTVYVDEFQAVPPSSVKSLLEKSRASRIAMTLSVQSFEQIIGAAGNNGETVLKSILDTCGNFLIHAGAIAPSAERLSEIQGKDFFPTYSKMNDSENFILSLNWANRRNSKIRTDREELWITPPREFMNLSSPSASNNFTSTAMLVTKTTEDKRYKSTGALARKLQIIPNNEVLDEDILEGDVLEPVDAPEPESEPEVIESEIVGEPEVPEAAPESAPKSPSRKTIIENSVGDDPEWSSEDPKDGDSDFKFDLKHPQPKRISKSADELEKELSDELPKLGSLHDDELFSSDDFKPRTLKTTKPNEPERQTRKEEDPSNGTLPPLD